MAYAISMVTMNRKGILQQTLDAIISTTRREAETEGVEIFVTDNNSTDGSQELLGRYEKEGHLKSWCLSKNLGTDIGRNVHWAETAGKDTLRMDDKVLPLCDGWLYAMKKAAYDNHALTAVPYDPTVLHLYHLAPPVPFVRWDIDQGQGGPLIFIPAEARDALGACDELFSEHRYGWTDCTYIERARLLGWHFGFTLRVPVTMLAQANPASRDFAMQYHGLYVERVRQYKEAERDVFIPIEETIGYKAGLEARG